MTKSQRILKKSKRPVTHIKQTHIHMDLELDTVGW